MWPFSSKKYKSLSHAVLAGDLPAARRMLKQGSDPNRCDPDDDAYPIDYALNHGPEMVQLLVDHGAKVNTPGRVDATPLARAEARGLTEIASILKKHGARLRTADDPYTLDPRMRLQLNPKITQLAMLAKLSFPGEDPARIAERVEGKLNLEFPPEMSSGEQQAIRNDVRELIADKCGVKRTAPKSVATPEQVMRNTGMSEEQLTRMFMASLIEQGKDPFAGMPEDVRRDAERTFPDLLELARRKIGTPER